MSLSYDEKEKMYILSVGGSNQDDAWSQCRLGLCYYYGIGTGIDKVLGHKWFKIATSNFGKESVEGRNWSRAFEEVLSKDMTDEDMAKAQELADEWIKTNRGTN